MRVRRFAALGCCLIALGLVGCAGSGAATDRAEESESEDAAARPASQEPAQADGKSEDRDDDEDRDEAVPVEVVALGRGPIESVEDMTERLERVLRQQNEEPE